MTVKVDQKKVEQLAKQGQRGARVMSMLGKSGILIRVLKTEIGYTLLKDLAEEMDRILVKIINEDSNDKERAEYRVYKRILDSWSKQIDNYNKHAQ